MQKIDFNCGCSYSVKEIDGKMIIDYDVSSINFDCPKTWLMISEGNTKGVFQLESRLGQSMAKKLKPENIEQLSALISIMRPGSLEAFRDGKSVSNHYIDKKNGQESLDYFHPALEKSLKSTYGEMIYQEQAMEIAKDIAGFNLQEADMLRKAIGKKKPEEMAKVKEKFLDGAKKLEILSTDQAEQIFGWIEKSQRYSFNKSHAVSYAINGYLSAHAKAHFPLIFFLSYLRLAKDKISPQEEILELISNAKEMDINVFGPNLSMKNRDFAIRDKKIYFGLTNIKGLGDSVFDKLYEIIKDKNIAEYSWTQTLFNILININSTAAKGLIQCGALDYLKLSRNKMLYEYTLSCEFSKKELSNIYEILEQYNNLSVIDISRLLISKYKVTKPRQSKVLNIINHLNDTPYSMDDSPEWIADNERELLGVSITCSKTDSYDASYANTDCKNIKDFPNNKQFFIVAEIAGMNTILTKRGKNPGQEMCFLKISDSYGTTDCVVFPEEFMNNKSLLNEGRVLMFNGQKSSKDNTPIIKKCFVV